LPDRVVLGDTDDLPSAILLPGAERQHDGIADILLLPGKRHERADRVQCGLVLQCDGSELRLWPVRRRVLLRRGLDKRDAVFLRKRHLLSRWQRQRDRMPAGRILSGARAGQLHAESDRLVLQHDGHVVVHAVSDRQLVQHGGPVGIRAVHTRVVLRHVRAQRADRSLQRRTLLPCRLLVCDAVCVHVGHILSKWQRHGDHLSAGRILSRARADLLHAESDRWLLQPDRLDDVFSLHGRFILRHVGVERADRRL
jgi:hypothetical protein